MQVTAGILRLLFMIRAIVMQMLGNVACIDASGMHMDIETTGKDGQLQSKECHQGQKAHADTVISGCAHDKGIDGNNIRIPPPAPPKWRSKSPV